MSLDDLLFESQDSLKVATVEQDSDLVVLFVACQLKHATCPYCSISSNSIHSSYSRTIKDLPAFGNKVFISLKVRKFYCRNADCEKLLFAERFDGHFAPYKRMSDRLQNKLLKIALLTGGNAGEKLCRTLSIPISSSTLIRLIHKQEPDVPITSEAIGIDDWAFKKGINYGTAIIDLNQRKIIDLLPDRESQTVEN